MKNHFKYPKSVTICSFILFILFFHYKSLLFNSKLYISSNAHAPFTKQLALSENNITIQLFDRVNNNSLSKLKFLIYECKKARPCGGWADRLKGFYFFIYFFIGRQ